MAVENIIGEPNKDLDEVLRPLKEAAIMN